MLCVFIQTKYMHIKLLRERKKTFEHCEINKEEVHVTWSQWSYHYNPLPSFFAKQEEEQESKQSTIKEEEERGEDMEEEMMMNNDTSPRWKLYENPFYINTPPHKSSTTNTNPFKRRMDSELHLALNHILELQTQLRYERKARKKVESLARRLAKELNEERKQRKGMEGVCHELATHISSHQPHKEIQEERNMLRLAQALREQRLQMKLAEVKTVFGTTTTTTTTTTFLGGGRYGRRRD